MTKSKHLNVELPETTIAVFDAMWREYQNKVARVTKSGFADIVINKTLKFLDRQLNPEAPITEQEKGEIPW